MASETEVVNQALTLLGAERIAAIDDGSVNAVRASTIFAKLRDDLLRSSEWDFATIRDKLAQLGTDPIYGYAHAYAIPANWIRTIAVHHNENGTGNFDYRHETLNGQDVIVTDLDDVWMTYVFRNVDVSRWPADFERAMVEALARDLAVAVTASNTLQQTYEKRAPHTLARAKNVDSMGSFPERRPRGSWASSRGGRRSYGVGNP